MVERPIKKSEREAAKQTDQSGMAPASEVAPAQVAPAASNVPKPVKKGDRPVGSEAGSEDRSEDRGRGGKGQGKGRGKGRGRDSDDAPKAPFNPALVRGPKPTAKVEAPPVAEETPSEEAPVEDTEATEAPVEDTEATEVPADETPAETVAEASAEEPAETSDESEPA